MIRRLATPPAGWNGRTPTPPPGALSVNTVDNGGVKLAGYWDDGDSRAMTEAQWASYVSSATYTPPVEETNEQAVRSQVTAALATLQAIIDTPAATVTSIAQAQTAVRALQAQVKDEARILRRLIRLVVTDFTGTD